MAYEIESNEIDGIHVLIKMIHKGEHKADYQIIAMFVEPPVHADLLEHLGHMALSDVTQLLEYGSCENKAGYAYDLVVAGAEELQVEGYTNAN
tara:strand:+ start:288 stop:566 length:279 start_codon:yes stop_codon:yes gene_type:complete